MAQNGDRNPNDVVRFFFNSVDTAGAPITLAGTPSCRVYKDNGTTESTLGVTLTVDFDTVTGLHMVAVDTSASGAFYSVGSDFTVVLAAGTADGVDCAGAQIGQFSLQNRQVAVRAISNGVIAAATFAANALDAVWSTAARTLTAFSFGVTVTTNNDKTGYALSSAGVQAVWDALTSALTTVGSIGKRLADDIDATVSSRLASASYTAPLDAAGTRTAVGLASANLDTQLAAIPSANANADALLDRAAGVETNRTVRQAMRLMLAALAGKLSGAATTSVVVRDTNDSKNRITATVDADGNRTAVTLDAT